MKRKLLVVLFVLLCGFAFAASQVMYVAVEKATIKSSTSFFAKSSGTLSYGDKITVLSTKGNWSQISSSSPAITGWIQSTALTKKQIVTQGSRVTANADELALAGKGFSAEVEAEYKKSGDVNYTAVDNMEKNEIEPETLSKFITSGSLKGAE